MGRLLPRTRAVDAPDRPPRHLRIEDLDAEADDTLKLLSSGTARSILLLLYEAPSPPSEIAAHVDTSLQNVHYHLGRLEGADLVEVVDTWYSEKGREMSVYAPTNGALVITAGDNDDAVPRIAAGV